jgi:hypothetical protein
MIAAVLLAAAVSAATAPPDGTYTYDIAYGGQVTSATVTIKRDAVGLHVDEDTSIASKTATASLALDLTTLAPISYVASYNPGSSSPSSVAISFNGQGASETVDGQTSQPIGIAPLVGAPKLIVLDGALLAGFVVLPAIASNTSDNSMTAIVAANGTAYPIVIDRKLKAAHPTTVPAGDTSVSVITPTAFTIWYDPRTFVMDELDVPLQGVTETLRKHTAAAPTGSDRAALAVDVRH